MSRAKRTSPPKGGHTLALWAAGSAVILLAIVLLVLHFQPESVSAQVASRARRGEIVEQMSLHLASAVEAERGAVMATTDAESHAFADQARGQAALVESLEKTLDDQLPKGAAKGLLAQFRAQFSQLERVDAQLLDLAVKNTNLKASALAFGPAADAMQTMDAALSRVVARNADSAAANARRIMLLASEADANGLRVQALIPPHIAEESDAKMNAMEARMAEEARLARLDIERLQSLLPGDPDVEAARGSFARFQELQTQIVALSRENTNVKSLSLSLNEKRNVTAECEDLLAALGNAIGNEPIPGEVQSNPR